MSILLENQLYSPSGPLASFFATLDTRHCGAITMLDLRQFTDRFCSVFSISFVQKKLLLLLVSKGYTRLDRSGSGTLTLEDFLVYAPKIQCFLSGNSTSSENCTQEAKKRYQELCHGRDALPLSILANHCTALLPPLIPNKKLISLFIAYALYQLCTHQPIENTPLYILQQDWCDTAIELHFECTKSS